MSKQYKNMKTKSSDEFQTPEVAIHCLLPYIRHEWDIWECAWGGGSLAKHLTNAGYTVVGNTNVNFLTESPNFWFDCIITNPPYSLKDKFLEMCYYYEEPFALLLPLTALEGKKRGAMYREYGMQLIIPNKRINFVTPTGKSEKNGSSAWYQVAWFTWGLNLPKDLMFVDLE